MFRSQSKAVVTAVAVAVALAGCGGGSKAGAGSPTEGGSATAPKLTLGLVLGPQNLDASTGVAGGLTPYYTPVYDTLLLLRPDGTAAPMLATKWAYDSAETKLTLTLRTGVKFTDGEVFDATAAKANLDRNIKSAGPVAALSAVTDVSAPDPQTLVLTLKQKDPDVLSALGTSLSYMQAPKTFGSPDAATKPVGTGPYTISPSTVIGSQYVYKKNPNYWNNAAIHYDELDLKVFSSPSAMLNAIKSGQINAAAADNATEDQVKAAGWSITAQELDVAGIFIFDRDGKIVPALKDPRVRQAVNLAVDRAAVLKAVAGGKGTATAQLFTGANGSLDPALDVKWAYDPAKAKDLLAQAGHATDVQITMPTIAAMAPLMQVVKQQLGAVGITVNLVDAGPTFLTDLLTGKYAASYFQFQTGDDWFMMKELLLAASPFNPLHTDDPQVDALIEQYRTADAAGQAAALKQLNAYITDQAWFAPWYRVQNPWATDAHTTVQLLKGWAAPNVLFFAPKS